MDREVVKELIQNNLTSENLREEMARIVKDDVYRTRIKRDYEELHALLHQQQGASLQAAAEIHRFLTSAEALPQGSPVQG
jgi:lipid-A-disaccharide synthase